MEKVKTLLRKLEKLKSFYSILGLAILWIIASVFIPEFRTVSNLITVLRQSCVLLMLSSGLTAVVITGNIDLSVGATAGFVGCICARLLKADFPVFSVVIIGMAIGALVGLFNGLLVGKAKLPSFIATYGCKWVLEGAATIVMMGSVIFDLPEGFKWFGVGHVGQIPVILIFALVVTAILYIVLEHTTFGRNIFFIGSNRDAAKYSAIPVTKTLLSAFVICGICAGFAGLIITARLNAAEASMGSAYGLLTTAAVIVGGTSMLGGEGGILGTLIGAILLTVITNIMNLIGVNSDAQSLVVGLVIIMMVAIDSISREKRKNRVDRAMMT